MSNGHGGRRPGAGRKPGKVGAAKRELMEMAKGHAEDALSVLVEIAKNTRQPAAARVSAANAILDRGYGRPAQALEHSNPDGSMASPPAFVLNLAALSDEELDQLECLTDKARNSEGEGAA